jgi:hypothetical protein
MTIWLQQKYVNLLCSTFRNFRVKKSSPFLANYSCNICGDSSYNKKKARAYIGEKKDCLFFFCHNCNASMSFESYLYNQDYNLFKQYSFERFKENGNQRPKDLPEEKVIEFFEKPLKGPMGSLEQICNLPWNHPAKKYVIDRQIPLKYHGKLRYTEHFNKFVNDLLPGKLNENYKEGRLVIPFFDENGLCFGFQGRNFSENKTLKYITIMLTDKKPKIFGLDTVDLTKKFYVFEGPIDSMFIDNAIAVTGSNPDYNFIDGNKNAVFVFDNEKRNKFTVKNIEKAIDKGVNIALFPEKIKEKDINDMIKAGKSSIDIQKIIDDNTFNGLKAKMKLTTWRK